MSEEQTKGIETDKGCAEFTAMVEVWHQKFGKRPYLYVTLDETAEGCALAFGGKGKDLEYMVGAILNEDQLKPFIIGSMLSLLAGAVKFQKESEQKSVEPAPEPEAASVEG